MELHRPHRRNLAAIITMVTWLAAACDGPRHPDGGGTADGGDAGDPPPRCERDLECGDTSAFCARWRCRPGDPGADARGCVNLGPPCDGGACDEEADRCGAPGWCSEGRAGCEQPGDCDGDGAPSPECGGTDCDDADGSRYPGNAEICDAEGHDEDCDEETAGDTDADADTYVSAACCNGATCGDDCDDADASIHPGVGEVCDGADNDCSGLADETAGLCPGGSCLAGRCDFDAWDRTFGDESSDSADDVAVDAAGAVYVTGVIRGSADFGAGRRTVAGAPSARAVYVVSYAADGTHRWDYVSPAASFVGSPTAPRTSWITLARITTAPTAPMP